MVMTCTKCSLPSYVVSEVDFYITINNTLCKFRSMLILKQRTRYKNKKFHFLTHRKICAYEKFENRKGVIRSRNSKDRQYNGRRKKGQKANRQTKLYTENQRSSNTNPAKHNTGDGQRCSGIVSSSCSTSSTCLFLLFKFRWQVIRGVRTVIYKDKVVSNLHKYNKNVYVRNIDKLYKTDISYVYIIVIVKHLVGINTVK